MALLRSALASGILALFAGCGDGLVDESYRGEALFSFGGQIISFTDLRPQGFEFRVGLFWSPSGDTAAPVETLVEQPSASVAVDFPATFRLSIFHPPDASMLSAAAGGGQVGVGVVLVYEDRDANGRFSSGELSGGAPTVALFYASGPVPAAASPTGVALVPGFQLVRLPQLCDPGGAIFEQPTPGDPSLPDCGVNVGAGCAIDVDCGGIGTCLHDLDGLDFPGGYCAVSATQQQCAPQRGLAVNIFEPQAPDRWYLACADDGDCRTAEGYACDRFLQICLPEVPIELEILSDFVMEPLCVEIDYDYDYDYDLP